MEFFPTSIRKLLPWEYFSESKRNINKTSDFPQKYLFMPEDVRCWPWHYFVSWNLVIRLYYKSASFQAIFSKYLNSSQKAGGGILLVIKDKLDVTALDLCQVYNRISLSVNVNYKVIHIMILIQYLICLNYLLLLERKLRNLLETAV